MKKTTSLNSDNDIENAVQIEDEEISENIENVENIEKNVDNSEKNNSKNENDAVLLKNGELNSISSDLTVSVIEPPEEVLAKKPVKITVVSLFLKALTIKKSKDEDERVKKLLPVNTLLSLILIIVSAGMFLLFFDLSDGKMFLPVLLCFCALSVPLALITMHYEFCLKKTVTAFQMLLTFCVGVILYAIIEAVNSRILVRFVYEGVLDAVFVPILWGIAELVALSLIIKAFNVTELSSCVLLAVCIGMGFCFTRCAYSLFSSLFLQLEITPQSGLNVGGIFDDEELLKNSVKELLKKIPLDCIYYPLMFSSWSVVIGNVASPLAAYRGAKKDHPFSMYLLLILVIALYMLCEFDASFGGFDVALKLFCGAVSLFVALRRVNDCLYNQTSVEFDDKNAKK